MYFLIGLYGSRDRRIKASYYLFLYTLSSSLLMFLAILFLYFTFGTTELELIKDLSYLKPQEEKLC
jgi:NADH:ubiquinone oxidoreductase subunit 4 (subunit M)